MPPSVVGSLNARAVLRAWCLLLLMLCASAALLAPHTTEAAAAISFLQYTAIETDFSSLPITFPDENLGTAAADRIIFLVIHGEACPSVASVTIAGISATELIDTFDPTSNEEVIALYWANVPSGTSGDIVVTSATNPCSFGLGVYRATGIGTSITPYDTATNLDDAVVMAIDIPEGGVLVGGASFAAGADGSILFTGVTERYNHTIFEGLNDDSPTVGGGEAGPLSLETNRNVTFDGTAGNAAGLAASFAAAAEVSSRSVLVKPPNNLGLVGYWSFNEGTSTVATDFSGNRNHGTLSGTTKPAWVAGKRGKALAFTEANDDYIAVGNTFDISSLPLTISVWIKPASEQLFKQIINKRDTYATNDMRFEMVLTFNGCDPGESNLYFRGDPAENIACFGTYEPPLNMWTLVTVVASSTGTELFVNGRFQESSVEVMSSFGTDATAQVRFGNAADGPDEFDGSMDEMRVYNRALAPSEIAKLYESGAVKFTTSSANLQAGSTLERGLVGLWTFDGPDVTTIIKDRSGQGYNGAFFGGATSSAKAIGKLGQALTFDGVDDEVSIEVGDSTPLDIRSSYTLSLWMRATSFAGAGNFDTLANRGFNQPYIALEDNEMQCGNTDATTSSGQNLQIGAWYHLTCVYDTVANTITGYINGVQVLQAGETDDNTGGGGVPFAIGRFPQGAEWFNGAIDDVRVYNRALSPAEVAQLYKLGTVIIRQ